MTPSVPLVTPNVLWRTAFRIWSGVGKHQSTRQTMNDASGDLHAPADKPEGQQIENESSCNRTRPFLHTVQNNRKVKSTQKKLQKV
jgi:hypothetical protein